MKPLIAIIFVLIIAVSGCISESGIPGKTQIGVGDTVLTNITPAYTQNITESVSAITPSKENISLINQTQTSETPKNITCPPDCSDSNPCTSDTCNSETNYLCTHTNIGGPAEECSGSAGTCKEYLCSSGSCMIYTTQNCCGNGNCEQNESHANCPSDCAATTPETTNILINEIMYAPNSFWGGQYNEWIELYNQGASSVDITGWAITDIDAGETKNRNITSATVPASGYIILAKSDDKFSSNYTVTCNVVKVSFVLNNDNDTITLLDANGKQMDKVTYQSSTGGMKNNRTLERNVNGVFIEGLTDGGTPCAKNSI